MKQRKLRITFNSDWHIGSGAGIPGSVDRQVLRDADGLPYIPGKTLTGILRDAAEWIVDVREMHDDGRGWREALTSLFGEQPDAHRRSGSRSAGQHAASEAAIGISSAELAEEVRAVLTGADGERLGLKTALFEAHPGVSIDRETGRAKDDMLFSAERTRRDCVLEPCITAFRTLSKDEEDLLSDAVKAVRRIGGKRRRGAGSCRLEWAGDWHEPDFGADGAPDLFSGTGGVTINVRFRTLQPLIINKTTLGNEVRSDIVIPGTSVLPYFANDVFGAVGRDEMRSCIMDGDISVSTLLPEFGGEPSLPVPLCLAEEKESRIKVNRMVSPQSYDKNGRPVQMKDIRSGFVTVSDGAMTYCGTPGLKTVRTHNTVDDETQRPTSDVGGLFTYEAIGAGQDFAGTLRISERLAEKIRALPDEERRRISRMLAHDVHSFGRSRKDEYGAAELRCSAGAGDDLSSCRLYNGEYLIVLLRSELLIRGEDGGWSVCLEDVKQLLQERLGVKLSDDDDGWIGDGSGGRVSPIGGCRGHSIRIDRRESWHRGWMLPRPSLLCFKAGSIFMFRVDDPDKWDEDRAASLVSDGLGERRAEGYGRLLVNPPFLFDPKIRSAEEGDGEDKDRRADAQIAPDLLSALRDDEQRGFVRALAGTALLRRFRRAARREAFSIVTNNEAVPFSCFSRAEWSKKPGTSQFGSLREAAASIEAAGSAEIFGRWARTLRKRDSDKNRWEKSWIAMFEELADKPGMIWDMRTAFGSIRDDFSALLPDLDGDPRFAGIFLDVLCEAAFDDAKKQKGGDSE